MDLTYAPSIESEPIPGRAVPRLPDETNPQAYGQGIGRALEGAGDIAQHVQDVKNHAAEIARQQAVVTQATDAHNQLQALSLKLTHDPDTGALTKQGKNAFNLQGTYLPQFDEQATKIIGGIPDAQARQAVQQSATVMRNQLNEQLDSHEMQQHKIFGADTAKASVQMGIQAGVANYNHPDILQTNKDTVDDSLGNLAQQQGWSDEQLSAAQQEAHSKLHTGVIDAMLGDDKFQMADVYLKANEKDMEPSSVWSARRTIDEHIKQKQNEAKQDIMDRYGDSMTASRFGLPNSIAVSKGELQIAYPHDWQRKWDGLQMMNRAGSQAQEFNTLPPDQIKARLDAAYPKNGGPEAAQQIEAYDIMARAAQQSAQARQADPAKFAIENAGWKPLDPTQQNWTQQLTFRSNSLDQVSQLTGVNTPLLTKGETKVLAQRLDAMPPDARLNAISQIRAALPDQQHYDSVMKSIQPESALTTIAAGLVDRPTTGPLPSWHNDAFEPKSQIAQQIMEGQDLLRAKDEKGMKTTFPMPPDKTGAQAGLDTAWGEAQGGATSDLFRGLPYAAADRYDAYKAAYAAKASKAGVSNGVLNPDIAKQAAEEVIGPHATYGHTEVSVPRGMDPTRFTAVMDAAADQAMKQSGFSDADVQNYRGYGLRQLGDLGSGRYTMINGNGDPLKKDGRPVIIDLNKQFQGDNQPKPAADKPGLFRSLFGSTTGPAVTGDGTVQ